MVELRVALFTGGMRLMGLLEAKAALRDDSDFTRVIHEIVAFRDERDWAKFHTPRNLAAALSIEVSELQELMLWKSDDETASLLASAGGHRDAAFELADVLIYALLFCHTLGIEPLEAIRSKMAENARKYPVEAVKGIALKYTQLRPLSK